ncbi:hypothetical protein HPB50_014377 [Hyalomma asiaticum]|uniref:Uncharacterized protein n=1 Tax=Hyalomma asiaticum TaxID=266040 RepID=A0ACB7SDU6_HYAAI|nr:hypothetical protein HPB50_014377 [Hyalomma asiaticum]
MRSLQLSLRTPVAVVHPHVETAVGDWTWLTGTFGSDGLVCRTCGTPYPAVYMHLRHVFRYHIVHIGHVYTAVVETFQTDSIRTKIDAIKPKEKYADGLPAVATRKFDAGDPVWMRSFQRSRRWIPGVVQDQQGSRMVTVDCAQGRHRRHLDQLRRRAASMHSDLDQTSKQESSEDTGERVQDSPEERVAESTTPPLLRRSTRPRKPAERYGF